MTNNVYVVFLIRENDGLLNTPQSMLRLQKHLRDAGICCHFETGILKLPEKMVGEFYKLNVLANEAQGVTQILELRNDIQFQLPVVS